nr:galactose-1-phosphate uridylyltransferase [Naumannella cuiyingiana]
MADGREIIYFDDPGTPPRPVPSVDRRSLAPRPETPQLRRDPLTGDWITMATARQARAVLPTLDPLAPQGTDNPNSEIPDDYDVAVFENRSPAFGPDVAESVGAGPGDPGLFDHRRAVGRCEVVCFSPDSTGSFATQTATRARTVVEAWAARTAALSRVPGVEQVFAFENRGVEIGVTLHHPHGQIYGYPYITPRTSALLRQIDSYGPTLMGDIVAAELSGPRVVLRGQHWSAYVPFAARWPLEVHLVPHRQLPDLAATSSEERAELAVATLELLRGVDALYDTPTPYIAGWHQAPVHQHRDTVRLTWQITSPRRGPDKLKYLAGSEAAMGGWVGDVAPEEQADRLREAIARAEREHPVVAR